MPHVVRRPQLSLLPLLLAATLGGACGSPTPEAPVASSAESPAPTRTLSMTRSPFGTLPDGTAVELVHADQRQRHRGEGHHLRRHHHVVEGARQGTATRRHRARLRHARGLPRPSRPIFGAIVGRYGNRIAQGDLHARRQDVHARRPTTAPNHLHGGPQGLRQGRLEGRALRATPPRSAWSSRTRARTARRATPARCRPTVTYTLTDDNELRDRLRGDDRQGDARQPDAPHLLQPGRRRARRHPRPRARRSTPTATRRSTTTLIPTGELAPRRGHAVRLPDSPRPSAHASTRIDAQIDLGGGYDHNFVLNRARRPASRSPPASHEPTTGRTLEVSTTEPGVQFYTGNFLDGTITGKGGTVYRAAHGLLPRDAALPGLAQPAGVPVDHPEARRDLQAEHLVHVRREVGATAVTASLTVGV